MLNKRVLIIATILIIIVASYLFSARMNMENHKIPSNYQRQNISLLKFVSSENCLYSFDTREIEELKSLNINGIRICPLYSLDWNGKIREDIPESRITALIEKAHEAGLAVFLDMNVGGRPTKTGEPKSRYSDPRYVDEFYKIALKWAKIAEEEKVEFYSPMNEPNLMFANSALVTQWINNSQGLRPFFSGNLVLKLAGEGPEKIENISNYDYLAFDIMWSDDKYQELKYYLKNIVEKGNDLKRKYRLKGFFFGELGAERSAVNKNIQAEIFKTFLEETWNKTNGYCFLGWSDLEFKFRDNIKAKEIIKNWYARDV